MSKQILNECVLTRRGFFAIGSAGMLATAGLAGCSAPDADSGSDTGEDADAVAVDVLTYNGNPPYCYLDDDGTLIGYDVDVLKAVDERLEGYAFDIDSMDFNAMITACESGSAELVSCQLVPNEERKAKFLFCEEPFCLSPLVFATADPDIKTLDDMAGKSVLSSTSSYEYGMLQNYNEANPDKALVIETISTTTIADAFKMVASGQVDSYLCYDGSFDAVNEEAGTGLYKTDVVMCESTYFMLNEAQEELRDAIDVVLAEMKEDGSLAEIAVEDLGVDVFAEYGDVLSDNELEG